jgi:CRISPR-associated endonuclease/helicase Cas3
MSLSEADRAFYAHSLADRERQYWQPLAEHLRAVAKGAGTRGAKFGATNAASLAGLFHDLGKYAPAFQRRLDGAGDRVDHSTAGAQEVVQSATSGDDRMIARVIAHAIAGHHAGLPDTLGDAASLGERLKRKVDALDPAWRREISFVASDLMPNAMKWGDAKSVAYRSAFFGRMVFSCLVDADFRDTEDFYCAAEGRSIDRDWRSLPSIVDELILRLDAYVAEKFPAASATPVKRLRGEILNHVCGRAVEEQGLFTLTVPTGGGKTLSSLAFALEHARRHNLDRIVYAIPFTSIIDQTASIFRDVLGKEVVLEHHASIDESHIAGREARDKLHLAMEDWAAPVVVTTNVQLFESLHSNRPSRCRRLHNLAKSVIVLDEAQTIPLHVLRPCLAALDELARNYGCSVVLCTATQPAVAAPEFEGGLRLGPERELAPEPLRLHQQLRRVRLEHLGDRSDDQLIEALGGTAQGLMIVNSRAHALALYRKAVEARPVFAGANGDASGKLLRVLDKKAIVNTQRRRVLGIVSRDYRLVSNREALDWACLCCRKVFPETKDTEWEVRATDAPSNAGHCFIDLVHNSAALDFSVVPAQGRPEVFGPFIRVTNSYNGLRALAFDVGFLRKVCKNGLILPDTIIRFKFTHMRRDIKETISFDVSHERLAKLKSSFGSYLDALRACAVRSDQFAAFSRAVLSIRVPEKVEPKSREAADWESLTAHLAALCDRYGRELGENAYAVLNVITDFASHPPANRYVQRERHSLQRLAGTWVSAFARRCRQPAFDLTAYLAELTAPKTEASSG